MDVFVKRTGTYLQRALDSHARSALHHNPKHGTVSANWQTTC